MHKIGFATLAAGLLTLAGGSTAWAQNDTIRLGTSAAVSGGTDTELVRWRGGYSRGYGGGYGYRGWGGYGYRGWGGYGWGGYVGYRPYYYARPYYRPLVYVNYYVPNYYPAPVSYYPISGQAQVQATYVQSPAQVQYQTTTGRPQLLPAPANVPQQQAPGPQTFPYDGGPQAPLPDVDPASGPKPFIPLQGKVVSLPRETTLGSTQHMLVSLNSSAQSTARPAPNAYTYPAYGDQPLPAVRKQTK